MIKKFVLNGLYREIKISFNEEMEVLRHGSPVFNRVKKQFAHGLKEIPDRFDLDKQDQNLVKRGGKARVAVGVWC